MAILRKVKAIVKEQVKVLLFAIVFACILLPISSFFLEDVTLTEAVVSETTNLRSSKPTATIGKQRINDRPIIGIFTQPGEYQIDGETFFEYIAGSYVKYIESAGARVVPVRYQNSKEELQSLFSKLNGVLLPGGGTELIPGEPYYEAGVALWEYVKTDPTFPIFGTCLGFELLSCLASGSDSALIKSGDFDASNVSWPVRLTSSAKKSRLFQDIDPQVLLAVERENITYNEHNNGITPEIFYNTPSLSSNFNVLGTGRDKKQKEFVAIIEGKERPFWGIQFHPEKATFEW
eukprot:CAMPEP_0204867784 /NCGR_PEP_ID=MMETSP1348-20121228/24137_1 /ASSEMBLY_ACC=CAM_ASM_000700 /TAXON_ID=215587 /ORGANISM="Aplanochytrium stocchinoi, Strain GSBS06" /LENGTH=290 /DNA_ID=CAMNT_0052020385 /DNA_START=169 /DNA_END=1038 /DNA_ORIENTATION=+